MARASAEPTGIMVADGVVGGVLAQAGRIRQLPKCARPIDSPIGPPGRSPPRLPSGPTAPASWPRRRPAETGLARTSRRPGRVVPPRCPSVAGCVKSTIQPRGVFSRTQRVLIDCRQFNQIDRQAATGYAEQLNLLKWPAQRGRRRQWFGHRGRRRQWFGHRGRRPPHGLRNTLSSGSSRPGPSPSLLAQELRFLACCLRSSKCWVIRKAGLILHLTMSARRFQAAARRHIPSGIAESRL